jgi:hypothetical protein
MKDFKSNRFQSLKRDRPRWLEGAVVMGASDLGQVAEVPQSKIASKTGTVKRPVSFSCP